MLKPISDIFERIHRLMFDRAYLHYAIQWHSTFHAFRTVILVAILTTLLAAGIRYHRLTENFGPKFVETFGVLVFSKGELTKGHEVARTLDPRNVTELVRLLLGIKVPLTNVPEVRLRYSADPMDPPHASLDVMTHQAVYTVAVPQKNPETKPEYHSTYFPWPEELDGTFSATNITSALTQNWASVVLTLFSLLFFVSLSLLMTYLLVLLLLVVIYSHAEETLKSWHVRSRLLLYLLLPYFILFPLFALTLDGLGNVTNVALIASSIMMIRLYGYIKTPSSPENSTTNAE